MMLRKQFLKKEYLLPIFVLLLIALSYPFAFKKTWDAWQRSRQLSKQMEQVSNLSFQPGYLQRKTTNLAKAIDLFKVDSLNYRSLLLNTIGKAAELEKVRILEVPTETGSPYYVNPTFTIQKLGFEGGFFELERFFNRLEKERGIGFIRSAEYKLTDQHTSFSTQKRLNLFLYLETVK